jgi:hypothetical protein
VKTQADVLNWVHIRMPVPFSSHHITLLVDPVIFNFWGGGGGNAYVFLLRLKLISELPEKEIACLSLTVKYEDHLKSS